MITIRVGHEHYQLPESIEELNIRSILCIGRLLSKGVEMLEFKVAFAFDFMRLTHIRHKVDETDLFRISELMDFFDDPELKKLDEKGLWNMLPAETAIRKEFYENPFCSMRVDKHERSVFAPKAELRNFTLSQFANTDQAFSQWNTDPEAKYRFFAHLYSCTSSLDYKKRLELAKKVHPSELYFLKLHFESCKSLLVYNHPELFAGESKGDSSWIDVYHNMAGDKMGIMKEVEETNLWVAYRIMSKTLKEHEELKRKYNL